MFELFCKKYYNGRNRSGARKVSKANWKEKQNHDKKKHFFKDVKKRKEKTTYYYKVKAYRNVDGKKVYGAYRAGKQIKVK
ncbi:hypothetical protein LQZ18_12270 [Lachnospiraceae bacterium ZAX-1]